MGAALGEGLLEGVGLLGGLEATRVDATRDDDGAACGRAGAAQAASVRAARMTVMTPQARISRVRRAADITGAA
jgi:hypothetical protein